MDPGDDIHCYFGACGAEKDYWQMNAFSYDRYVMDTEEPRLLGVAPIAGTYQAGQEVTISLIFNEIVDAASSTGLSDVEVVTTWGAFPYAAAQIPTCCTSRDGRGGGGELSSLHHQRANIRICATVRCRTYRQRLRQRGRLAEQRQAHGEHHQGKPRNLEWHRLRHRRRHKRQHSSILLY